jgi:hypothetical protein
VQHTRRRPELVEGLLTDTAVAAWFDKLTTAELGRQEIPPATGSTQGRNINADW